jgi:hypothetical protein
MCQYEVYIFFQNKVLRYELLLFFEDVGSNFLAI